MSSNAAELADLRKIKAALACVDARLRAFDESRDEKFDEALQSLETTIRDGFSALELSGRDIRDDLTILDRRVRTEAGKLVEKLDRSLP